MAFDGAISFAIDRSSVRRRDADGRLHVELTNISKATVNPYWGREIPGAAELGLDPETVYQVFRDPAALALGADSFNNIQLMDDHIVVSADEPQETRVVGSTGTDATFDGEYLKNSLVVWTASSIARIESEEQKEISCSYRYVASLKSGVYKGLPYTVVMSNIVGNHVALVKEGRAGPDVVVADGKIGESKMAKFSVIKGILAARFATDTAIARADRPYLTVALDEMEETVEAEDADLDEAEVETKVKDAAKDKKAADEAEAAKDKKAKDKKKAKDEEKDPPETVGDSEKDDKDDAAMDAALNTRIQNASTLAADAAVAAYAAKRDALEAAKLDVAPIVGAIHGLDSADAVYRYALDSAKVDHAEVKETAALRALVRMVPKAGDGPTPIAMDSASRGNVSSLFPNLARYA